MSSYYDGVLGIDDPDGFDNLVNGSPSVTDFDLAMEEAAETDNKQLLFSLYSVLSDMVLSNFENNPAKFQEFETLTPVLFTGNPDSKVMVIGRDLGRTEVEKKEVLVGDAGQLFRKAMADIGINVLTDLYMTNLVPFKPKNNKAFSPSVVDEYWWVLRSQIDIVKPDVFITLGWESTKWIATKIFNKRLRSGILKKSGKIITLGHRTQFIMVHPSYVLRAGGYGTPEYGKYMTVPLNIFKERIWTKIN